MHQINKDTICSISTQTEIMLIMKQSFVCFLERQNYRVRRFIYEQNKIGVEVFQRIWWFCVFQRTGWIVVVALGYARGLDNSWSLNGLNGLGYFIGSLFKVLQLTGWFGVF